MNIEQVEQVVHVLDPEACLLDLVEVCFPVGAIGRVLRKNGQNISRTFRRQTERCVHIYDNGTGLVEIS